MLTLFAFGLLAACVFAFQLPCGVVLQPGDPLFVNASRIDNARVQRTPSLVLMAACEADVVASVQWARQQNASISVLAGGHSAEGFSVGAKSVEPLGRVTENPSAE